MHKTIRAWWIALILLAALCPPSVHAQSPALPHSFYGAVTINGIPAPIGTVVEVRGQGVVVGGIEFSNPITTTVEGLYGGPAIWDAKLVAQGTVGSPVANGTPLEFYVNQARAQCTLQPGGEWQDTFPFHAGENTNLNLRVGTGPSVTATPTRTLTKTLMPTSTLTASATPVWTPTMMWTPTVTGMPTTGPSPTATRTATSGPTPTFTRTPSVTRTATVGPTATFTRTPTGGARTATPTVTATETPGGPPPVGTIVLQYGVDGYEGNQDTGLNQWDHPTAHGFDEEIFVHANQLQRALIRFELPDLPAGAQLTSAKLQLWVVYRNVERPLHVSVYQVRRPWDEFEANWELARTGVRWGKPGCDDVYDRAPDAIDTKTLSNQEVWFELDVTPLAQFWATYPDWNFGMLLVGQADITVQYKVATSDHYNPAIRPKLILSYVVVTATPTASPTTSPSRTATPLPSVTAVATATTTTVVSPTATWTVTPTSVAAATATVTASPTGPARVYLPAILRNY